ncbi:extracellular solute-binding protein [Aureibacillus halotolerans]|uniref:Carbohydrate ABC transporter substrate-binding protein (CUT1 family) n=1 Tax=Aureibacillus halotolerans TaxID=1508390 RepID=A0A4R6TZF2_9BACI|nr:extracellular solute-binding protein [Aureibacillus halotolerans]TDQ37733.1 carbohydrate ABC transporter substrate-binding protein (CUT1 family) [Aureibacillus halotolerans]
MKHVMNSLLFAVLLIALTACGSGGSEQQSEASDGAVELTLWTDWTEDRPENTAYKQTIEKFNQEHEDIKVTIEAIPHDQYETKLRTQAAGKQLPDMFRVWPGARLEPLAKGGATLPLDPIMDTWKDVIPESALKAYQYDGTQYAIPANISLTSLIYYRKDMVADAGFETFPKTYDELKALITALNDAGTTPIALGNKSIWPLQSVYISTIADRFTGSDFLPNVLSGEGTFENPLFVDSLAVIDEMTKLNAFNSDLNTIDESQARGKFIAGDTAMHFAGSWAIGPILDSIEDLDNIGVAPFPSFAGGEGDPSAIAGSAGGAIALSSQLEGEKQEAAFTFMKYFYSDPLYQELVKANIVVPVEVEVGDDVPAVYQEANALMQGGITPVYDATLSPELTDLINNGLQSITLGDMTPEELAKKMQEANESAQE